MAATRKMRRRDAEQLRGRVAGHARGGRSQRGQRRSVSRPRRRRCATAENGCGGQRGACPKEAGQEADEGALEIRAGAHGHGRRKGRQEGGGPARGGQVEEGDHRAVGQAAKGRRGDSALIAAAHPRRRRDQDIIPRLWSRVAAAMGPALFRRARRPVGRLRRHLGGAPRQGKRRPDGGRGAATQRGVDGQVGLCIVHCSRYGPRKHEILALLRVARSPHRRRRTSRRRRSRTPRPRLHITDASKRR
mmetsp:Transcript_24682/g.84487  ORF Transcript_24682/g.84487 Transcript_24682/m.84487 type:complete len:247 (+) Transcript_24682:584-1324(+)